MARSLNNSQVDRPSPITKAAVTAPAAANPAPAPAAPPAAAGPGHLFVTAVPTPTTIKVDGQPFGSMIPNREFPAGPHTLRFEGVDSLGPWYAERAIEIRPGETTRLVRIVLQVRRP